MAVVSKSVTVRVYGRFKRRKSFPSTFSP